MAPAEPDDHPVKQARKQAGLTQGDVAEAAGCSVPLVSMIESGYQSSPSKRSAIAQAVGGSIGSYWPT